MNVSPAFINAIRLALADDFVPLSGGSADTLYEDNVIALPRGYISGLEISNNVADATNDIDIALGMCRDSTDSVNIVLPTTITKRLDAAWAVGDGNGGLDTGSIANTTYHVHVIRRSDTDVVDALFSTSATAPTLPANYDDFRRVGSIIRASAAILAFKQVGNTFLFDSPVTDHSSTAAFAFALKTITVPAGIVVEPLFQGGFTQGAGAGQVALQVFDATLSNNVGVEVIGSTASTTQRITSGRSGIFTNTSSQVFLLVVLGGASTLSAMGLLTRGWVDNI